MQIWRYGHTPSVIDQNLFDVLQNTGYLDFIFAPRRKYTESNKSQTRLQTSLPRRAWSPDRLMTSDTTTYRIYVLNSCFTFTKTTDTWIVLTILGSQLPMRTMRPFDGFLYPLCRCLELVVSRRSNVTWFQVSHDLILTMHGLHFNCYLPQVRFEKCEKRFHTVQTTWIEPSWFA